MTRVKICGITLYRDAVCCIDSGVNALGFIFYSKSKRYISPSNAKEIISKLPPFVSFVGVFVNASRAEIDSISMHSGINTIQLHGDETPDFCNGFSLPVIKSIRINDKVDIDYVESYDVQAILFDTYITNEYGGTGKTFNWDILKNIKLKKNIILSGGLNPGNIPHAIREISPYAVDVSSGVESSPGIKDHRKIYELTEAVKNA